MKAMGLQKNEDIAKAFDQAYPNQQEKQKKTDLIRGVSNFNKFFKPTIKASKNVKQTATKHQNEEVK